MTTNSRGKQVERYPRIIIWAGIHKCELGGYRISEPELEWLAHELSDWLDIPITRDS